jgi:hypothetical protein
MQVNSVKKTEVASPAGNPLMVVKEESKQGGESIPTKVSNAVSSSVESGKVFVQNIPENVQSFGTKTKDVAVDIGEGIAGAAETGFDYAKEGYEWTKKKGSEGFEWTKGAIHDSTA